MFRLFQPPSFCFWPFHSARCCVHRPYSYYRSRTAKNAPWPFWLQSCSEIFRKLQYSLLISDDTAFTWILDCRSKQCVELHLHASKTSLYAGTVLFKYAKPRMYSEFVSLNERTTKCNVWTNSCCSPFRHEIIVFSHHIYFWDIFPRILRFLSQRIKYVILPYLIAKPTFSDDVSDTMTTKSWRIGLHYKSLSMG